ncbi:C40 family peptidase [Kitasatospora sp. NPDC058965]|uniref:C40 family peptidase n=1 Tax=Kitasatospora sp. NPDC058965 TaxID=3346682 RepID=UPI0036B53257
MRAATGLGIRAVTTAVLAITAVPGPVAAADADATRYVNVPVATLWTSPQSPRPGVDDLALGRQPDVRGWIASMSDAQKRELDAQTQALYGARVTVDRTVTVAGVVWDHVWADGQPAPVDGPGRGAYPGWVQDEQLTSRHVAGTGEWVHVGSRTAWAYRSPQDAAAHGGSGRVAEFSFDTSFSTVDRGPGWVEAAGADGPLYFAADDVTATAQHVTGDDVVAAARRFLSPPLPYLWAGDSGFGFDCSGFTSSLYASFGITVPRDAGPQLDASEPGQVPAGSAPAVRISQESELAPGDLAAFRNSSGAVVHVALVSGVTDGMPTVIEAPRTGLPIREVPIAQVGDGKVDFAGASRFLAP